MTKQRWAKTFADRLRMVMYAKDINQNELAAMARISQFAISGYLAGTHIPSAYNAVKIARALEVPVDKLIDHIT